MKIRNSKLFAAALNLMSGSLWNLKFKTQEIPNTISAQDEANITDIQNQRDIQDLILALQQQKRD